VPCYTSLAYGRHVSSTSCMALRSRHSCGLVQTWYDSVDGPQLIAAAPPGCQSSIALGRRRADENNHEPRRTLSHHICVLSACALDIAARRIWKFLLSMCVVPEEMLWSSLYLSYVVPDPSHPRTTTSSTFVSVRPFTPACPVMLLGIIDLYLDTADNSIICHLSAV